MTTRHILTLPGLALAGMLLLFQPAAAQVISVDLAGSATGSDLLLATDVAGIEPADNWNVVLGNPGSDVALSDDNGDPTTASLVAFSYVSSTIGGTPGDGEEKLFKGYSQRPGSDPVIFTVNDIPYATYDLYVYVESDSVGRTGYVTTSQTGSPEYYFTTFGGGGQPASYVQITSTTPGVFTQGNYALFTGLTDEDLTFGSYDKNTWSGITGFQIVASAPVPEPAAGALLLGGLGLVLLRRRRA